MANFFENDQIKAHLICRACNQRFDVPKILPCGENACQSCLNNLLEEFRNWNILERRLEYQCPVCQNYHPIPEDGVFRIDEAALRLLNEKPKDVWRGEKIDNLRVLLRENKSKTQDIKEMVESYDQTFMTQHFDRVRVELENSFKIQMRHLEQAKESLDRQINTKELHLKNGVNKAKNHTLPNIEVQMKEFDVEMGKNLEKHSFSPPEVDQSVSRAMAMKNSFNQEYARLQYALFEFNDYEFRSAQKHIDAGSLGIFQKNNISNNSTR